MLNVKMITVDGKIHLGEPTNDIVGPAEIFRQLLSIFKHVKVKSFKFTQNEILVEFQQPINLLNYKPYVDVKVFDVLDIELTPDYIKAAFKSEEPAKPEPTKPVEQKPVIEEKPKEESFIVTDLKPDDVEIKELTIDKKYKNIPKGWFKVNFDEDKYTWVLFYTHDNKRAPIKKSGEYLFLANGAKTATPINNSKKS